MTPNPPLDDDRDLDALLRAGLAARPAHSPPPDLATRSLRLARSRAAAQPILRLHRLARYTGAAAAVLILAIILLCARHLTSSTTTDTTSTDTTLVTTDANSTTTTNWPLTLLSTAVLLLAGLGLSRALDPADPIPDPRALLA